MKEKLKKQIRELDKKLYRLYWFTKGDISVVNHHLFPDMYTRLSKLDYKRKKLRIKLKSLCKQSIKF